MSAKQSSSQQSLSVADRLKRKLAKIKAAERKKFLNENIVRLEKNGDLSYEAVRTYSTYKPEAQATGTAAERWSPAADKPKHSDNDLPDQPSQNPVNSNLLPNKLPQTPDSHEIGNLIADSTGWVAVFCEVKHGAQTQTDIALAPSDAIAEADQELPPNAGISCHEPSPTGNQQAADPLEELLDRALVATKTRRGRPPALDDQAKGQLIALLSVGMSMRQAAVVLGVSHTAVQKTLKADPALAEEITAARFQAQLQPLACVIREARRSWKAATWLLKYLDSKITSHEETPDERRARQQRESDEFFARAHGPSVNAHEPSVKTRHVAR
jgi:hypothetical protein